MHFRLFDRPLIVDDPLSTMYIDGQYDDYDPGSSYEGRVQIRNSVGFCKVEVLDSNIPPGAYVYVDNISKEVVLKWPAYTPPVETITLLENGDFSKGDTGSWTNTGEGNPFVIEPDSSGNMSMKFKSGFSGGHFSRSPLAPVTNINRQITLTGQIAQGKSSKRKLWGGVLLAWFDENRNILSWNESNWINSGGDYKEARVIAAPTNPLTKYVAAQIHFDRRGQNHPGWASNIRWDHVWEQGYESDETLFLRVRVTDSLNNTAEHYGEIEERSIWFSSRPYPVNQVPETMIQSVGVLGVRIADQPRYTDEITQLGPRVLSATLAESLIRHTQYPELARQFTPSVLGGSLRAVLQTYRTVEAMQLASPRVLSATNLVKLVSSSVREEIIQTSPSILRGTLV